MKYAVLFILLCLSQIEACTGIKLVAKDGSIVHGRTAEFGVDLDLSFLYVPKNYSFTGTTPQGPGLSYTAKYAAIGCIAYSSPAIMDGMNEKGLSVGVFFFPNYAGYGLITAENQSSALSPIDFSNWLLTQFESVDEIKNSLGNIVIAPTVLSGWGSTPPPFHYYVIDRNGDSIVIEPIRGDLIVYDNPLGVMSNSPSFDWHMTNLNNYLNLSPFNAPPKTIEGVEFVPFGQGSGLIGLPGDFSPPSRFVRAALYSMTAIAPMNAAEGVLQAFHILNQFDIPVGVIRAGTKGGFHTDRTLATVVRDPDSLRYYLRTYEDQSIKMVDLKSFDKSITTLKRLPLNSKQPIENVTAYFK